MWEEIDVGFLVNGSQLLGYLNFLKNANFKRHLQKKFEKMAKIYLFCIKTLKTIQKHISHTGSTLSNFSTNLWIIVPFSKFKTLTKIII